MGVSMVTYDYNAALAKPEQDDFAPDKSLLFLEGTIELLQANSFLHDETVDSWLEQVRRGLIIYPPELCEEGVGGTYILHDEYGQPVAVFKPEDEEAFAVNNPKDNEGQVYKTSIRIGEAASKEVAAYLLDHEHAAGVPTTVMACITSNRFHSRYESMESLPRQPKTKIGSLQRYIRNTCQSWEMGPSSFPVRQVHRIGLLDCRILNLDRHGGNILVEYIKDEGGRRVTPKLHPIDHGYSLPHSLEEGWFEWLTWPQAKVPFDQETKEMVSRIDVEEDILKLRSAGLQLRPECLHVLRVTTMLVKKAVAANMTLHDLGTMMCRQNMDVPSELENLYEKAVEEAKTAIGADNTDDALLDEDDVTSTTTTHTAIATPMWIEPVFYEILGQLFDDTVQQTSMVRVFAETDVI